MPDAITLCRARYVCPVSSPPLDDGAVAVAGERIVAVGAFADLVARLPSARLVDLGASVLMPGAVNAHTHLQLTHMAGAIPTDVPFAEWILTLTRARRAARPEDDVPAVAEAVAMLRACGTAAVADIATHGLAVGPLAESGLRGIVYYELIGRDPQAAPAILRYGQEQLARWRADYGGTRLRFGLSPHSTYTVSRELLLLATEWCAGEGVPLSIHAAESPAETAFLCTGGGPIADTLYAGLGVPLPPADPPGCSPIAYLDRLGVLDARPLLAHGVQVDRDDLARLARTRAPVAHCPRSNGRLGCGRLPFAGYQAEGVRLALGTDSLASSPSLSIWEEMAYAGALHRAAGETPAPHDLLRLATLGGAAALGFDGELGSLAAGKAAELAWASLDGLAPGERETADAALAALCAGRLAPRRVAL
jgi:5-methylthioadenosine/S-adenosylhomocysteine deaminase